MSLLTEAIHNLRSDSEWLIKDDDLSTLEFIKPKNTVKPTQLEIDNEIASIIAAKQAQALAKETTRQAVLNKLGLTAEEVAALLK